MHLIGCVTSSMIIKRRYHKQPAEVIVNKRLSHHNQTAKYTAILTLASSRLLFEPMNFSLT